MLGSETLDELIGSYPHISSARTLSMERTESARCALLEHSTSGLDVVAFGSLARAEVTDESDFDYLVLATTLPADPDIVLTILSAADRLRDKWATESARATGPVAKPGASGVFGEAVGAFDLVNQIGLQGDTNHSLTRRMLFLEESVSLMNADVHNEVMVATLSRYLKLDGETTKKVPRFLLNDVTRYWHTITVDYQAKVRTGPVDSGLRYLKLIMPRKVLYAGTLMSVLLCAADGYHEATVDGLRPQFACPPLTRLLQGYPEAPDIVRAAMVTVCEVIDEYLMLSSQREWRNKMKPCTKQSGVHEFNRMRGRADDLQRALETIFFQWDLIADESRRTLAF